MITELHEISKSYLNSDSTVKNEVLSGVSLSLKKGEAMAIVGPSGCGKSTLLNIIGTIDAPSSGTVKFEGTELSGLSADQMAEIRNEKIGFIFQSHHLFPQLNVIENVLVPTIPKKSKKYSKEATQRAHRLLDLVELSDHITKFPGQLSGGECQRVAVVRALINQPELILADEPTGSLDEKSADNIGKLLSDINKNENVAMIVVTHSLALAKTIGNIHNLTGGKISKA